MPAKIHYNYAEGCRKCGLTTWLDKEIILKPYIDENKRVIHLCSNCYETMQKYYYGTYKPFLID